MEDNTAEDSGLEVRRMDRLILLNGMEGTAGEYRGLDRKSAYLSGGYRIGMVQLIKWKGSEWIGNDQNNIESRVGEHTALDHK